jgi:hypothetical protein
MSLMTEPDSLISPQPPVSRYRALCPLAVTSVVIAALSWMTVFHWGFVAVPLAGVIFGWVALRQIRKAPDELAGRAASLIGLIGSAALGIVGLTFFATGYTSEVPFGYTRLNYEDLQPDPSKPTEAAPETAVNMDDKKVFVKGFMQTPRQRTHIKEFIMNPCSGECPFCIKSPKRTEMIRVILPGDLEAEYTTRQIGVAGRFHVDVNDPGGIPYSIEAEYPVR